MKEKSLADFSLNLKYLKNYFKYIKHVKLTKMWKKVEFCKKKKDIDQTSKRTYELNKIPRTKFYSKLKMHDTAGLGFCILMLKKILKL